MNQEIIGTQWFKCDLHLHTPASKCFKDSEVTPEQWVQTAISKGLDCVAVTDHNAAEWIDKIINAAKSTSLTVFPGVEITCSDAKIHLLILFDTDKTTQTVEDFLLRAKIDRANFGEQTAHTNMNLEDISNLAYESNALIIPAHIDEFNGLCEAGSEIIKNFLKLPQINAVQVVHENFTLADREYQKTKDDFLLTLNHYYRISDKDLESKKLKFTEERMKNARRVVIDSKQKAILTFSDNPHEEKCSEHGLWGIGSRYTWIKMENQPSLESLRQALLLPAHRIRNDFSTPPNDIPDLWIQKIVFRNTEISPLNNDISIVFNPQMNTIIGGRGSGKSSILHFIRGVFNRGDELKSLSNIHSDFLSFFQTRDRKKNKGGVLKNESEIDIFFSRKGLTYKLCYKQLDKTTSIFQHDIDSNTFVKKDNAALLDSFEFDIFSQKQIYEISNSPNSLRIRVDESESNISLIKTELEEFRKNYFELSTKCRNLQYDISDKAKIELEKEDLETKIARFSQSGAESFIKNLQVFSVEKIALDALVKEIENKGQKFSEIIQTIKVSEFEIDKIREEFIEELNPLLTSTFAEIKVVEDEIEKLKNSYIEIGSKLRENIENSEWQKEHIKNSEKLFEVKNALSEQGINVEGVENSIELLNQKKDKLFEITKKEAELAELVKNKSDVKSLYFDKRLQLQKARQTFLDTILKGRNVQAKVVFCRDIDTYSEEMKRIFSIEDSSYSDDIIKLQKKWDSIGKAQILTCNQSVFDLLLGIKSTQSIENEFTQRFCKSKIQVLNEQDLDEIDLLFPEDEIQIEYKVAGSFKSISNASPGQKTAAVLTLLLAHGTKPLILDQPEDDLDNRLIYDLVVEQMSKSKDFRQIIVVTHNANIPVNGDSENIIVMNSLTKNIQVKIAGGIEKQEIKDEICDIMEGGIKAFEMRSKRYGGFISS